MRASSAAEPMVLGESVPPRACCSWKALGLLAIIVGSGCTVLWSSGGDNEHQSAEELAAVVPGVKRAPTFLAPRSQSRSISTRAGIFDNLFGGGVPKVDPRDDERYRLPLGDINPKNPTAWFEVTIGGEPMGRIEMEIKKDDVPKTADNFLQLCSGTKGFGYKNSPFHRVIPGFMCQGGDFTNQDGTGGKSIYGNRFNDENFSLEHTGPGIMSMANAGPDTNGSQFFLCTAQTAFLDGKHVVFGQVTKGYSVAKAVERMGSQSGQTKQPVMVSDCGVEGYNAPLFGFLR